MVTDTFLISFSCKCVADLFLCMSVYADGSICLDILQNRWSPTYDVSSILTSIQVGRVSLPFHTFWFTVKHDDSIQGHPKYLSWLFNLQDVNIFIIRLLFFSLAVIAGRAKPQQPSQQSGRTALSGKQERVREEGDGHRGAELGGCLSSSCFLLSTLLSITRSSPSKYFSLSFLPHREKKSRKKENTATISEELKCHTGGGARTTKPEWTLPCLPMHFRETGEGKSILYLFPVFTFIFYFFLLHDVT